MVDPFGEQIKIERRRAGLWVFILVAFLAAISFMLSRAWDPRGVHWSFKPSPKGQIVEARVVRFGNNASRWRPDLIVVVAATPDGRTGQGALSIDELNRLDCKVGDPVKVRVVGATLAVDAKTCGKPK